MVFQPGQSEPRYGGHGDEAISHRGIEHGSRELYARRTVVGAKPDAERLGLGDVESRLHDLIAHDPNGVSAVATIGGVEVQQPIGRFPTITAIPWLPAKNVLGGEASDFTPWLLQEDSLEILGRALKLDDLTAIRSEHNVLGKRLDILARALDENGEEIPVCIENQYGTSDASHLGRLIAYLAQQERGRAVWIVEDAHDAFIAGVRFLNRTSTDEAGYYLVQVRFAAAPTDGYYVHFDVLAAPIAWEGSGRLGSGRVSPVNMAKVEYLQAIHDAAKPGLEAAGFAVSNPHARGAYLRLQWPDGHWFRELADGLDVRVTRNKAVVALYIEKFNDEMENVGALRVLNDLLSDELEAALPDQTTIVWNESGRGHRKSIRLEIDAGGYDVGDPSAAADWAVLCCIAAGEVFNEPSVDLASAVERQLHPSVAADASYSVFDGIDE